MKMRAQDGHLFAEVTLRDVLERTDVSDMPMLSEIKRLYDENAKLREDNDRLIQAVEDLHDVKLEDKLVQLENENDKLRRRVGELEELTDGKLYIPQEWYAQLKTEDAKLRKLCAAMWNGSMTHMDFAERYAFIGEFADRMREQGIEVDE